MAICDNPDNIVTSEEAIFLASLAKASGDACAKKGQHNRAIADYSDAIRFDPKNASAFQSRGLAWRHKGKRDWAIADFDEAIRLDPNSAGSYYARGDAYAYKGQYDLAIADYDEAIRFNPQNAIAFFARGQAYGKKGDYDRANADFDEAIRLDPNFTLAINSRAWIIARKDELGGAKLLEQKSKPTEPVALGGAPNLVESFDDDEVQYYKDLDDTLSAELTEMMANNPHDKTDPQPDATKLITPDDMENYGHELIDLVKRAAKEAVDPELNALRQELLSLFAAQGATTMTAMPTTPSELTWAQIMETKGTATQHLILIWNKLTAIQKISIAVTIVIIGFLFMFRYEVVPTNRLGVVIQQDRWTGTTEMCVVQANRTLKCGK